MAFYRKNIGGAQQVTRIVLGVGAALLAPALLTGVAAWVMAAGGTMFALTGLIGYCPACAVVGIGTTCRS